MVLPTVGWALCNNQDNLPKTCSQANLDNSSIENPFSGAPRLYQAKNWNQMVHCEHTHLLMVWPGWWHLSLVRSGHLFLCLCPWVTSNHTRWASGWLSLLSRGLWVLGIRVFVVPLPPLTTTRKPGQYQEVVSNAQSRSHLGHVCPVG